MRTRPTLLRLARGAPILAMLASIFATSPIAMAAPICGTSAGHTICVTVPATSLSGPTAVMVTNSPNDSIVIATWIPSGKSAINLYTRFMPSAQTNDYSFVWPTQKYLDASGVLRLQADSTGSSPIQVPVTLSNGNSTDFQHTPNDWASFLPPDPWTAPSDPVVAAVGDGPADEPGPNALARSIASAAPNLFLFLGDIYETGTFVENLNHYGQNSMDGGPGTLWGAMGRITQPTLGNHEVKNRQAWLDYFHGRPLYTSFRFGNVLFFDLASSGASMAAGSTQYNYVQGILTDPTNPPPPCIVSFWHVPALGKGTVKDKVLAMWSLLADYGGDLVLNGHVHNMIEYKPLDDQLQLPSQGEPTMVELVSGSGGHKMGKAFTEDPRVAWSKGKVPAALYLTLDGAAKGGTPTSLSWAYIDKDGNTLRTGARSCGEGPSTPQAPSISGFSPTSGPVGTSVRIDGSGFSGTTDVRFNGTSVGSGNFTVDSDAQIAAIVQSGATTGPISVTTPGGTATSSTDFTVTAPGSVVLTFTPDADTWLNSERPDTNYGSKPEIKVDGEPIKDGLLRFTVSGVGSSSIAGATLRLYCTDPSPNGGSVYRVADNSWQEKPMTWNTAPSADPTPFGSLGAVSVDTWAELDLTSLVTGDGTYSIRIASPHMNAAFYVSKEGTAGLAPQLVVALA